MRWLLFILGSPATFRLSHLVAKERGPFAVFERLRNAMPGGRGSAKDWLSYIFCLSLSASALVLDSLAWGNESQMGGMGHHLAKFLLINQALMLKK
jgi:hypothetical protein